MTSAEEPEGREGAKSRRTLSYGYVVFFVLVVAYFFSYFYRSANAVIAEDLARDLSLSASQLGFMTSLFFLAFAAAQVPLGSALDRFGARFVTSSLLLSAVVGSLIFASARSFTTLAVGRALIGLGMAGVLMGSLKAFSGWFSARVFATVSGLFLGLGSLGALAAATPLAALNEEFGWRAVFFGGTILILLSATAIAAFVRPGPAAAGGTPSSEEEGSLRQIFASSTFWRVGLMGFALTGAMFAYQGLWAGPYLLERVGLEPIATGNLLLLMGIGVSGGYMVMGWIADRLGLARVTVAGAIGMIVVQLVLAFLPATVPAGLLALLFLLFGIFGSCSVLFFALIREAFPPQMTGRAITAVNFLGMIGSALLQWLLGVIIGLFPSGPDGSYPPAAYNSALLFTSALMLAFLPYFWPLLSRSKEGPTPARD